jgi:hypothetical protein
MPRFGLWDSVALVIPDRTVILHVQAQCFAFTLTSSSHSPYFSPSLHLHARFALILTLPSPGLCLAFGLITALFLHSPASSHQHVSSDAISLVMEFHNVLIFSLGVSYLWMG